METEHSKFAALVVSVASAVFVLALLAYLFYSAALQNDHFSQYGKLIANADCVDDSCRMLQLESDIQQMRSARVGYALLYRFSVSTAAIVVALATIVLGSVLVFDRVHGAQTTAAQIEMAQYKAIIQSTWPGLIMVFFGTVSLWFSIAVAGPLAPKITAVDKPVFHPDENWPATALGRGASVSIAGVTWNGPTDTQTTPPAASLFEEQDTQTEGTE